MTIITALLLFLAGLVSGIINAIAGGGTFLTFGAMTLAGLPPISANATSSIVQFPGYITSALAYKETVKREWKALAILSVVSIVGSLGGALFLLSLSNPSFKSMVPWLLLAATALFAAGPKLRPAQSVEHPPSSPLGIAIQFITSIYGGFFGAGMGIMMLASLSLATGGDYHRLNAIKNFLSIIIALVAIFVFTAGGAISWLHGIIMLPGAGLGGYLGVYVAKRVPQTWLRYAVIAVGLFLAGYYFFKA
ncbi:sulfite exporter TauE/SafE family protein [Rhizobium sp. L1K21]|uniref:sulfite exporter TauE/SafE family protein n=1 Tax=Rhizobium sp. L1K21 TaxID=2954933 RepID=UPI0020930E2F|nr:sulfite exporter TauE/SafE family protein [Rhizobium sp. L1K21]MCO6188092.1 sulfite exporter TauE/SafE family protein [Rhizobium sp. L1K21]